MTPKVKINPSSVFLVSGGAKGITAKGVIKLAQRFKCKWILLGRSDIAGDEPTWARDYFNESELKKRIMESLLAQGEKPTPKRVQEMFKTLSSRREIQKTLSALEQAGSQAEYLSVDVTDAIALREKLAPVVERFGPISGIIHGAGNLADKLIDKKTEQDFAMVYNPKVKGLENLLRCVSANQLDYLVLFSSVVGFYGNAGQADYALANEILTKSAHLVKQHHPDCHVVAINWGPWDSGMVTPELKKAYAARNIEILPVEGATQMLVKELDAAHQQTAQVIIGNPLPAPVTNLGPELHTHRIHRQLTLAANPFLEDHVIAGSPVLPATCAIAWMTNACEELYPGYKFFSLANFKVLKGIIFDKNLASEYILDLKEIVKNNSHEIEFEAKISSKNKKEKIRYHFSTQVKILRQIPVPLTYDSLNLTPDQTIPSSRKSFYQNGALSLFHGSSFQGVERILNVSSEKLTAQCVVPSLEERQQGQFPLQTFNPYIGDVQSHSIWLWLQHFHHSVCLPEGIAKFEQFAEVPFSKPFYLSMEVKSKTKTTVVADIITHNQQGKIYSYMEGAKATILPSKLYNRTPMMA